MPVPVNELKQRLRSVQNAMAQQGLTACVYTLPENIYYLSGYDSLSYDRLRALVVPAAGAPVLVIPAWEAVAGRTAVAEYCGFLPEQDPDGRLGDALTLVIGAGSQCRVGLEESHYFLRVKTYKALVSRFPGVTWVNLMGIVENARLIKSPYEVGCIRQAAAAASAGLAEAMRLAAAGQTENDLAGGLLSSMLRSGSQYPASPPYVTAGARTGLPHATWEGARLAEGDGVLVENAASSGRYHAAIMRTAFVGRAIREQAEAYHVVVQVLENMIAAIRPGVTAAAVDAVGRSTFRAAGFERKHNTGYSIGLAFPPGWNEAYMFALNPGNERELRPGIALYLIPSLNVEGRFTVGCGDTVLVTETGCETLTAAERRL